VTDGRAGRRANTEHVTNQSARPAASPHPSHVEPDEPSGCRVGACGAVLGLIGEARATGDVMAWAELLGLARHCLLGLGLGAVRHQLVGDPGAVAPATAHREAAARPRSAARVSVRRQGLRWELTLGEWTAQVRDSRGMQYLAVLTANADQDILAATLVSGLMSGDWDGNAPSAPQPVLDDVARRHYRQRLSNLAEAIEDSQADAQRRDALTRERDWLLHELAAGAGLGGRAKAFITNEERARVAVGKAIRRAIDHIGRIAPAIGNHLRQRVRTGRYCVYLPDR
jgi:hypothetical protein